MKRIGAYLFVIDQALSSLITFVLIAGLSRSGGPSLVGVVAVLQTVALAGLAAARAIGVDVWTASGTPKENRREAISSSVLVSIIVFAANTVPWFIMSNGEWLLALYWMTTPLIVLLDAVRIMLLHAKRTWISAGLQCLTLMALLGSLVFSGGSAQFLSVYLAGTFVSVAFGFLALQILPPLPSLKYALRNRERSGPFLFEISLGSITQQFLFMLLAILSTIEAAGQIRIAQTLLGPMSVIHSGLSPLLLKKLAGMRHRSKRAVARAGVRFGFMLSAYSLIGAVALSVILPIHILGFNLLEGLTGHYDLGIPPILAICGGALACGAIMLGTGTSARILGATGTLNRWRIGIVLPQVAAVAAASSTGNPLIAASGLALSAVFGALVSIIVLARHAGPRGRRAKPA